MNYLVTGSAGHLGEALVRRLRSDGRRVTGVDLLPSSHTDRVGSLVDPDFVHTCLKGCQVVFHAATLHKPHVATHSRREFVDTNVTGTLNLLEASLAHKLRSFIFTSTTSAFGGALSPNSGTAWIDEEVRPIPKNIYGVTKTAAEDLCQLFHQLHGLPCLVLRTSRFFAEEDDNRERRNSFQDLNLKVVEYLYRRVDLEDVVEAHLLAAEKAPSIGFGRFIVSATSPFKKSHLPRLHDALPGLVERLVPEYVDLFETRGWRMPSGIDRVYCNKKARELLGWRPRFDFREVVRRLAMGESAFSELAIQVGKKGYHAQVFADGPYPV